MSHEPQRVLLKASGESVTLSRPHTIAEILELIGAEILDTVRLSEGRVLIVDDDGHSKGKPYNEAATRLYWSRTGGPVPHFIAGDAVVTLDADFA